VANPLSRYAIGDRDTLAFNPDGSLDLYLQHDSPGLEKESNWLPADAGPFNVSLRLYWPKDEAINARVVAAAHQQARVPGQSGSSFCLSTHHAADDIDGATRAYAG
jgi:hypothetical protein